jgi:hypothetical protein
MCLLHKLKLTKELAQYDPDNAAYMDYYEQTLINHIGIAKPGDSDSMQHGTTYMLPIGPVLRKHMEEIIIASLAVMVQAWKIMSSIRKQLFQE